MHHSLVESCRWIEYSKKHIEKRRECQAKVSRERNPSLTCGVAQASLPNVTNFSKGKTIWSRTIKTLSELEQVKLARAKAMTEKCRAET